ncbi:hypothetical protein ElyMa_001227400 [Elysia marginata]|uniref:Uncharacterized protein n=1 Tax=Elysia marginata TaxID=1093978 RepID=A0AAV4I7Z4_9GAST|nr:hypothetical protein ElyMa_001227400 [Elysia marginata]
MSVAKHFNLDDHTHQHVNIIAIDQLPGSDNISLLNKETHSIHTLVTTESHGMNIKEQESFPISIRCKKCFTTAPRSPPVAPSSKPSLYSFISLES